MKPNLQRWRWGEWWLRTGQKAVTLITRLRGAAAAGPRTAGCPNRFDPMTASLRFVLGGAVASLLLAAAPVANAQIANCACSGAIALTPGSTFSMSTVSATSTGDPVPTCQ